MELERRLGGRAVEDELMDVAVAAAGEHGLNDRPRLVEGEYETDKLAEESVDGRTGLKRF